MYDDNNIFAKIIRAEIPSTKIYEDEYILAIQNLYPKAQTHVLVIPKGKFTDFADFVSSADEKFIAHYFKTVKMIASNLGLDQTDYKLITNNGKNAGQEIFHFHTHLLSGEFLSNL